MNDEHVPHVPVADAAAAKRALRRRVLDARAALTAAEVEARAVRLAAHLLTTPEVQAARTVTAYVSTPDEPGTGPLLEHLWGRGERRGERRVLLPVLLADGDLDWAPYAGPDSLAPARLGLLEPTTTPLGVDAVAGADVVLLPGLAASHTGHRCGRGGGSYDRALARVGTGTWTCLLLHPDEVGLPVPVEAHDRPVDAVVTAEGLVRF